MTADALTPDALDGVAIDPTRQPPEPLPTVAGIPFAYTGGCNVLITAPTGAGKSTLVEVVAIDAALAGLRVAYASGEVSGPEADARAADVARRRGIEVDDDLRAALDRLRYLDLPTVLDHARRDPPGVVASLAAAYDVIAIDPTSTVASSLGLDFDASNRDYVAFHDRYVRPLIEAGRTVIQVDNIGHDREARGRAKGASAKQDKADVILTCRVITGPALALTATKVRSVRAPFQRGDEWRFDRASYGITRVTADASGDGDGTRPFRPDVLMERVSRALEAAPGMTRTALKSDVKGRDNWVGRAVDQLVTEAFIAARDVPARPGSGRGGDRTEYYVLEAFRAAEHPEPRTPAEPRPNPGPAVVPEPRPNPGPLSVGGAGVPGPGFDGASNGRTPAGSIRNAILGADDG